MDHETVIETDVFDLLSKIPYKQSAEELAVETALEEYQMSKLFKDEASIEALSLMINDIYVGDLVEKATGAAISLKERLKRVGQAVGSFVRYLQRISYHKIVNEKFIRSRFDGLKRAYVDYFYNGVGNPESYVIAPTYDTIAKRLDGLHRCVMFLKGVATSADVSEKLDITTYAKLVQMSNGSLAVKSSDKGFVNHLVWNPPVLDRFTIAGSKFTDPDNINHLCNSVLFVKYKTMEGIDDIVKACMKRAKQLSDASDDLVSYEVEEDTAEKYMHDYSCAYMLSKMVKDIAEQGIQREVNTIAINYIHKLKSIKTDS